MGVKREITRLEKRGIYTTGAIRKEQTGHNVDRVDRYKDYHQSIINEAWTCV